MQVRKLSLALLLLLFTAGLLHAVPTTYVDSATDFSPANPSTGQTVTWKPGTVDAVSGLRFGTTAFSSVQAGIDAADAGGTVLIAAGTYDGGAVLDIDKNLLVRGDGDDATFLSGGSNGDNGPDSGEHRVLDISSSTAIVTLDDLAIVDGQGNVTGGSAVANNEGGGIFNLGILTLNRCLVARNVVTLGGGIYNGGTLTLNSSTLSDNRGSGLANDGVATINSSTISGNFNFNNGGGIANFSNATVTVNDSVIANNDANYGAGISNGQNAILNVNNSELSRNAASLNGGGIRNHAGTATLNDCLLEFNTTTGDGGGAGIHNSAGFNGSTSRLNVYDSILSGNRSTAFTTGDFSRGGGLLNDGIAHLERSDLLGNVAEFGGGLYNRGSKATLTMSDSTFDGNIAEGSGDFSSGGALYNDRNATITNSTFSANEADDEGGAIINSRYEVPLGGGSYQVFGAVLNLTNCTLSGNSADSGGAIYNNNSQGVLNLVHCTVTGNNARFNPGINNDVQNTTSDGTLNLTNSIVIGNNPDPRFLTGVNVAGPVNSIGNNLTEIPMGHTLASILDPLEENGGPTQTHALPSGSPAIDAANSNNTPDSLTKDQRGARRMSGSTIDIGAYEAQVQPQITSYQPGKDSNLKSGSVIKIRFTRALSMGNGEVRLRTFSGTVVPSSIAFSSAGNDLSITVGSLADIPAGTRFYVEIDGDALVSTSDGTPYSGTRDSRDMSFYTAPGKVYVDAAADFSPANPSDGATVTWKPGAPDQVTGLIFGSNAFSTLSTAFAGVRVGGEIRIAAGTYDEGAELVVNSSVTLRGDGANQTFLSGGNSHRVILMQGGVSTELTLHDLSVINGAASAGAGVHNSAAGPINIIGCSFSGNIGSVGAGGINSSGDSELTVISSTFTNNGGYLSGAIYGLGTITNSTLSGNSATGVGGAIVMAGDLTIINSTITGNSATLSTPVPGIIEQTGGGGIMNNMNDDNGGILTLVNTIVAGNRSSTGVGPDIFSLDTVAQGVNFVGILTDSDLTAGASVLTYAVSEDIDDLLHTTLSDLGGTTLSHALVPGSPAIDAGSDTTLPADTFDLDGDSNLTEALPLDQLGFARIVGASVDIGAVEFVAPPLITLASPVDGTTNFSAADALIYVFDQDVLVNTAAITLRSAADDSIIPATISVSGDTLTITPDAPLDEATDYYVEFGTQTISNLTSTAFFYGFSRVNFTSGIINAYVDAAGDFTPANPSNGQTVTWNGASGAVAGLTYGVNAFDNIQEAADLVVANGTVFIASGTYTEGAQIEINDSLTLQGDGATATILSGEDSYRPIYTTTNGKDVIINDLSITQGSTSGSNSEGSGGGILNDASLTLNRVMLYDNFASNGGGAIRNGLDSELTINDSTLYDNQAGNRHGPGNTNAQTGIGGAILTIGKVVLNNSTLSGNYARNDGGAINIQYEEASLEINHSTIVDNESFDFSGGVYISTTVADVRINNSIIAGNIASSTGSDISSSSSLTFEGVNFIGNVLNLNAFRPGTDLTFTTGQAIDDLIAPLADNDGPTLTHAPLAGSPLIEGGDNSTLPSELTHDQRGFVRVSGASVDIGAVELGAAFVDAAGDYTITTDQGAAGLDAGDTVTWNGLFFGAPVPGLIFGSDAFLTVRDAVAAVSSSGNVYIAEGTYLEGAEINISKRVTLQGDGADITILSGNDAHRVLGLSGASTDVALIGLTIANGNNGQGAGIFHDGGHLTIKACAIFNSRANGSYAFGGGVYVSNGATLIVSDSTLSGNTATGSSEGFGGAIWSGGTTQLINSTVSGNSVNYGGGGIYNTGSLELIHTTVTDNIGMLSGGISSSSGATVSLTNSLIAGNIGSDLTTHSSGAAPTTLGVNFIGVLAPSKLVESSTVLCYNNTTASSASDVLVTTLADNGGRTLTHALVLGGPAVNAGDDTAIAADITTDQRGETRIFSSAVDIGAVEMIISPTLVSSDPVTGGARLPSDISITLTFDQDVFAGDGEIILRRSDNDQAITSTVLISGNTVTITPSANLPEGLDFYIEIEADALVNIAGQAFAGVSDTTTLAFGVCFSEVYVDDAGDFSPANPADGDTVTWTGSAATITNLTFGLNAFSSVPDAVDAVCVGGTVYIAEGSYTPGATMIITKDLTFQGDGASTILDGEDSHTVLRVQSAANVTLNDLSIINGRSAPNQDGGALNVSNASATINQCVFNGNSARDDGGAISSFSATVTIIDSTFTDNSADDSAGAFINLGSTFTVLNSTFSGNTAVKVGGVMTHVSGSTTLINSTFSGNSITGSGIGGRGGAIHTNGGQGDTLVSLINCTVTGNTASLSGGGVLVSGEEPDVLFLSNCIIAGNTSTDAGPDVAGPITTRGANFIGDTAGATVSGTGTVSTFASTSTTINDLLDTTLSDNTGPTLTHAIVVGGPAFNTGDNNSIPEGIITDQRGVARISAAIVDLGAVELDSAPKLVSVDPIGGSVGLAPDATFELTFDQNVQAGTGDILIRYASDDTILQRIAIGSATTNGATLSFALSPNLPEGTAFYIDFETGVLINAFGKSYVVANREDLAFITCFSEVYVDEAGDFSPGNPVDGDIVTWTGSEATVSNLTFGLNAFASVQEAVDNVCAGGTVFIAEGTYSEEVQIEVSKSLTLQGDGEATVLSGYDAHRVLYLTTEADPITVNINDLSIRDGYTFSTRFPAGAGAGVFVDTDVTMEMRNAFVMDGSSSLNAGICGLEGSIMIIDNTSVTGNTVATSAGGASRGIGIYNLGRLDISNSNVENNSYIGPELTSLQGGGLASTGELIVTNCLFNGNNGVGSGGGIFLFSGSSATIVNSSITNNILGDGVDNFGTGGGLHNNGGIVTVVGCLIANNFAGMSGGGITNGSFGVLNLYNTTVSGNNSIGNDYNGGGGIVNTATLTMINSTITNNACQSEEGGINFGIGSGAETFAYNTIVAGNSGVGNFPDAVPVLIDGTNNIIGLPEGITNINQILAPLADNGGLTFTHAIVANSPALNAGDNAQIPDGISTDQRGEGFTRAVGSAVDIGAFEIQNTPPVITLLGASVIRIECGIETYSELGATVADDQDGDLTDDLVIAGDTVNSTMLGEYTITYNVVDSLDAPAIEVTRTVIVEDTTAPVITLTGVSPVRIQAGIDSYTELGATVFDACDSGVAVVTGGDTVDTNTIGVYTITYNATDASQNAAVQVTRIVNVVAPPKFSIAALSASVSEGDTGTVNATFTITRSGATERSGSIDWSIALVGDLTAADFVATSGTVEFDAESTSETLTVQIQGDNLAELDEAFTVTLSNALPTGALIDAANDSADGSINNDDSAPVANEDGLYEVVEDGSLTVLVANGVLANDTDADDGNGSPNLIVSSLIDDVEHGDLTLNEDGSFTYTPDEDYFGSDAFTYQVSDGTNTEQAIANIRVNEQVDLEVAVEVLQDPLVAGGDAFAVFRITVINHGPSDATGVTLTQSSILPSGVSITDSVASTGSFAAGAWTLDLAEAASATLTLTLQASESAASGLDALPFAIGVTAADQTDSNSSNDAANAAVSIISADDAELAISTVTSLSMQTGLLIGEVTITNEGAVTVPAFRVYVDNLPDDVQLYNRSGTADFGDPAESLPYLLSNAALAAGESTTLRVEYFRPSLALDFEPVYLIELLPATETPLPTAESGIAVERMLTLANGDILIEIASVPGSRYAVEYTENLEDGFIRIPQVITAVANRLQWIDNGAPKTATHPSEASSRFYRFVLLDIVD